MSAQNTKKSVQDLGRKARERTLRERSKRHSIVRLDAGGGGADSGGTGRGRGRRAAAAPQQQQTVGADHDGAETTTNDHDHPAAVVDHDAVDAPPAPAANNSKKRQRTTSGNSRLIRPTRTTAAAAHRKRPPPRRRRQPSRKQRHRKNSASDEKRIDPWIPKVPTIGHHAGAVMHNNDVINELEEEEEKYHSGQSSNLVRLHGLPVGTTPQQIRRFFSGLDVDGILVLLSTGGRSDTADAAVATPSSLSATTIRIKNWDDDDDNDEGEDESSAVVPRYPATFRVLVMFASAPIAALAVQRSGEVIDYAPAHAHNTTKTKNADTSRRTVAAKSDKPAAIDGSDDENEHDDNNSKNSTSDEHEDPYPPYKGAAIVVTRTLSKEVSDPMMEMVGVDILHLAAANNNIPIHQAFRPIQNQLQQTNVARILWSEMTRIIIDNEYWIDQDGLLLCNDTDKEEEGHDDADDLFPLHDISRSSSSLTTSDPTQIMDQYDHHVRHRNRLADEYDRLLGQVNVLASFENNSNDSSVETTTATYFSQALLLYEQELVAQDPVLRLTRTALNVLKAKIHHKDNALLQARRLHALTDGL